MSNHNGYGPGTRTREAAAWDPSEVELSYPVLPRPLLWCEDMSRQFADAEKASKAAEVAKESQSVGESQIDTQSSELAVPADESEAMAGIIGHLLR